MVGMGNLNFFLLAICFLLQFAGGSPDLKGLIGNQWQGTAPCAGLFAARWKQHPRDKQWKK